MILFAFDMFTIYPNFIISGIVWRLDTLIVSLFLEFFEIIEVFVVNGY